MRFISVLAVLFVFCSNTVTNVPETPKTAKINFVATNNDSLVNEAYWWLLLVTEDNPSGGEGEGTYTLLYGDKKSSFSYTLDFDKTFTLANTGFYYGHATGEIRYAASLTNKKPTNWDTIFVSVDENKVAVFPLSNN